MTQPLSQLLSKLQLQIIAEPQAQRECKGERERREQEYKYTTRSENIVNANLVLLLGFFLRV